MKMSRFNTRTSCLLFFVLTLNLSFAQKNQKFSLDDDTKKVKALLKRIDKDVSDTSVYANDVVHMAQGSRPITSKNELARILKTEVSAGTLMMTHELITIKSFPELVLTQGKATGTFQPSGGGTASSNPFKKFFGEWTLKDDNWSQNWGSGMEHIKMPGHHTVNREINTANSMLSVIDGAPPHGHIFWTYNPVKKIVGHLSSFGESRIGVGTGSVNGNGDVTLKVSFEGEPEGTYRIYTYKWLSDNEYELKSVQHNAQGEATGWFYGGTFVRIR